MILRWGVGETQTDIIESMANASEMQELGIKPSYVKWGKITPYKGTQIYEKYKNEEQVCLPQLKTFVEWMKQLGWNFQ